LSCCSSADKRFLQVTRLDELALNADAVQQRPPVVDGRRLIDHVLDQPAGETHQRQRRIQFGAATIYALSLLAAAPPLARAS